MATGGRKTQLQVVHEISRTINYNDSGVAAGLAVGVLPAGAVLDKTSVYVTTAFNAATTNTLSVGVTGTGTGLINAGAGGTIARIDTVVPIAAAGPLAADTTIYASYAQTGTAATAGVATIVVTYTPGVG